MCNASNIFETNLYKYGLPFAVKIPHYSIETYMTVCIIVSTFSTSECIKLVTYLAEHLTCIIVLL